MSGQVPDGEAKEVTLFLNGQQQLLDVWGTTFEGELGLRPGKNQIRAVAIGSQGTLAEGSVEVQYKPPAPSPAVRIVHPSDGAILGVSGPDVIEVEGAVAEPVANPGRVVFNGFTLPVAVRDGRFSAIVPAIGPEVSIWAEMGGERGSLRSSPVTVRSEPSKPARGYVLLYLPNHAGRVEARVRLMYRADPADPSGPRKAMVLPASGGGAGGQPSMLFAFRQTQPGAYALALDYAFPSGDSVERGWGLIFVPAQNGHRVLRLGPFSLSGKGRATLARFLLPYGVFWDEDSWFNGTAEGAEGVTKFRYSDGVSWTEPKGEPEFPNGK